jgi:outer membrane lipase/esterase
VSLAYTNLSVQGFTEDGAGALNLKVASQNADSLQTGVGAKISVPIKHGDIKIMPQVYASYQHEFSNNARGLDARLSQGSGTSIWVTDKPNRDFAVVGANLTAGFSKNLAVQVNYNVELGKGNDINHFVNAGLRYQF